MTGWLTGQANPEATPSIQPPPRKGSPTNDPHVAALLIAFALPAQAEMKIQEVTSPGGINAWLVEEHCIPFTALEIRFRGGTSLDAPEKRGAVNLMTALIEEGAGDMDSRAFAEARDGLAADFCFDSGGDSVGVSARFLTENRDQAVALLREALVKPRFDQDAIDRVREQVLSILRSDEKDPATHRLATPSTRWPSATHPYGSPGDGTIATVTALTRDDIVAAHKGALARDRIYVAAAGDITAAELGPLLDEPSRRSARHGCADAAACRLAAAARRQTVVDFPHAAVHCPFRSCRHSPR